MDLTDELRISNETPDSILGRAIADTNAGIDPADPAYADTVFGGIWDDLNRADAIEKDRLYDRLNEVVAAAIPGLSFGAFLDAWAGSVGLDRNEAVAAGGTVLFTGANGTVIPVGAQVSTEQTSDDDPVVFITTAGGTISGGTITLQATAVNAGTIGNIPTNTLTILDTAISGVTVTNASAMTGGADVETDEALQKRVVRKLSSPPGPGNADYYVNLALNKAGVRFVTVQPNTPSLGHVAVVITDVNNDPVPDALIDSLQADLDPSGSATQGAGQATIGATVVVSTPASLAVTVDVGGIQLAAGYTLDGDAGTHAVRALIEESVARYVNGLAVGGDVLHNKVIAAVVDVLGVVDIDQDALEINGVAGDLAVSGTQVASLTTPITQGT